MPFLQPALQLIRILLACCNPERTHFLGLCMPHVNVKQFRARVEYTPKSQPFVACRSSVQLSLVSSNHHADCYNTLSVGASTAQASVPVPYRSVVVREQTHEHLRLLLLCAPFNEVNKTPGDSKLPRNEMCSNLMASTRKVKSCKNSLRSENSFSAYP